MTLDEMFAEAEANARAFADKEEAERLRGAIRPHAARVQNMRDAARAEWEKWEAELVAKMAACERGEDDEDDEDEDGED